MEDNWSFVKFELPDSRIIYKAEDGTEFYDRDHYALYQRKLTYDRLYKQLMESRTWWEKLLGIKPDKFLNELFSKT